MTEEPPGSEYDDDGDADAASLASVVLVDRHDDVAAICGRIDTAPTYAVVVHAPNGNRSLSAELGMRRLQRHAEEGGKVLAIATRSSSLANRARQTGVPVARRPDQVRWDSGGKRVLRLGGHSVVTPALGGYVQAVAILAVVVIALGLGLTMAPAATVRVIPPAETLTEVVTITASADRDSIDLATMSVPARKVSAERKVTLVVPTTGKVPVGTKEAKAIVTMTNTGKSDITIPLNAILNGPAGIQFKLDLATAVPAGKSATQQASALKPGTSGNVAANTIKAWQDSRFSAVTVTNAAATGGADEDRQAVDVKDIVAISALATDLQKSATLRELVATSRPHDAVFLHTAETAVESGEPSAAAGTPADILMMDVTVKVTALAVLEDTLREVALKVLGKEQGAGLFLPGSVAAVETGARQIDAAAGTIKTELRVSGQFARNLTAEAVKDAVKGKSAGDAESTLKELYGIEDADVSVSPGWAPWLPRFSFRIDVEFGSKPDEGKDAQGVTVANDSAIKPTSTPTTATPRP